MVSNFLLRAQFKPQNSAYQIKQILTLTSTNHIIQPKHLKDIHKSNKSILDFKVLRILGQGSFGMVMLVQDSILNDISVNIENDNNKNKQFQYQQNYQKKQQISKLYAMKIIEKSSIKTQQQKIHTFSQRFILQSMDHPFIVRLHYAFQTSKKLFLLVDFMSGGQLFYLLRKSKKFNQQITQFYAAEILLALQYLHSRNIIYRDLKPQNILLDNEGHIKLTDFGLSKVCGEKNQVTYSICGTPEYIAPQIILGKGHNQSADWFSFGSVIYDMLTGKPPFYNRDKEQMLKKISSQQVPMPKQLSQNAKSLLKGLFQRNPKKRLGSLEQGGIQKIKSHQFFKEINFKDVYNKSFKTPPFKFNQSNINYDGFDNGLLFKQCGQPESSLNQKKWQSSYNGNKYEGFTYLKQHIQDFDMNELLVEPKNQVIDANNKKLCQQAIIKMVQEELPQNIIIIQGRQKIQQ